MRTRMKSEERRAAIVDSAVTLFAEKGFRGATTRELANALGVTEPVLYQHFRTKKDLYAAIIEAKAGDASRNATTFCSLADTDDDYAFCCSLGHLILERFEADPKLLRLLLFSALERHELSDMFFDRVMTDFLGLVAGYIRRRVRAGAFRTVDPVIAARGLIGMFNYHGLVGLLHPGRFGRPNRKRVVEQLVTLFLGGIAAENRSNGRRAGGRS